MQWAVVSVQEVLAAVQGGVMGGGGGGGAARLLNGDTAPEQTFMQPTKGTEDKGI